MKILDISCIHVVNGGTLLLECSKGSNLSVFFSGSPIATSKAE